MSNIVSKELFIEVLKKELSTIDLLNGISTINMGINNTIQMSYYETHLKCMCGLYEINIYELAFKCKEWAAKQYYSVNSGWSMTHWGGTYHVEVIREANKIKVLFSQSQDSEPEAIFKACQWILDNKKNQNEKN